MVFVMYGMAVLTILAAVSFAALQDARLVKAYKNRSG